MDRCVLCALISTSLVTKSPFPHDTDRLHEQASSHPQIHPSYLPTPTILPTYLTGTVPGGFKSLLDYSVKESSEDGLSFNLDPQR